MEEFEWGCGAGWQHEAGARAERHHRDTHIFPRLADPTKALLRSQGGPGSRLAFSTCPMCRITRLGSHDFRLLLLRRLQRPLPLTVCSCRCGRPPDAYGHHRAACARAGVLGRRGSVWRVWWPEFVHKRVAVCFLPHTLPNQTLNKLTSEPVIIASCEGTFPVRITGTTTLHANIELYRRNHATLALSWKSLGTTFSRTFTSPLHELGRLGGALASLCGQNDGLYLLCPECVTSCLSAHLCNGALQRETSRHQHPHP